MVGVYDEMSERSYPAYPGGTGLQRWHRELLRRVMEDEGFLVYSFEWWHFDFNGWEKYPILNVTFDQIPSEPVSHFVAPAGVPDLISTRNFLAAKEVSTQAQ
jgi:hypothetical protein